MRRAALPLAVLLAAAPAFAQTGTPDGGRVTAPAVEEVDPGRFTTRPADMAFGAYQRGYYLTALDRATPLALAGNAAAQTLIGEIYLRGLGVRRDIAKATEWFGKAAEKNVPEAMFQLAMILLDGGEEFGDRERAAELMKRAADTGHRIAQFNFAQMVLDRNRGRSGESEAVDYYRKAAEGGLADAQYALAQVYQYGVGGTGPDDAQYRSWLEQAARQGHDTAQIELGTWLVENSGRASAQEEGFSWLMRAARAGNPAARNRVAKLYRAGIGVEPDSVAAATWYLRARRAGLVDPVMEDHLAGLTEGELRLATLDSERLQ